MSQKVISWWKYNPLLQKPASLDPVRPWGWYWYYGPDPASGCSYGQYHDEDNDFDMITAKESIVYSPATGKPMQFVGLVPEEEFDKKLSKVTGKQFIGCSSNCTSCNAELVSDYDLSELDKVHCVKCGDLCEVSTVGNKKTIKGEKTMSAVKEQRIQNLKRRIRASILKKRRAEAANEKRIKLEDESRKKRVALRNNRRIKAEEEAKKEDEDELISLDTIMEAMDEEDCNEGEECEAAEGEELEESEDEALLDEEEECKDEVCAEDEELALDEEEPKVELDEEVEFEKPEAGEKKEDEYYDLDMVLSMINKKAKLASKTKKKIKAEDVVAPKVEPKAEPKVEVKVEEDAEKEPKDEALLDEEKDKEIEKEVSLLDDEPAKEEAPAPKEELEAMKFEPLASLASFKEIRKEDIDMALYHEDSENPTWNVTVAGMPTAKIQLRKQSAPDEIRAVFCSEDYAKDLMVHCEKTGFIQTMNKVKADFWSNHTSNRKIADRFHNEAKASFDTERKKLLATFKQDFRNCMNIVSAGMSKNFYPDLGNALKEHLFTNLRTVGLPEQTAISVVEKSFVEGAAPYFDALFEKSEDYMNLTTDARKEIAAAISHGSSIEQTVSLENTTPATLGERVSQASVVASVNSGAPMRVARDVVLDTNEYKTQLRNAWRSY